MTAAFVLVLLLVVVLVLATERVAVEVVALSTIVLLVLSGTLTPSQALSGFAGPTVLMIAGVMLLSGAVVHNGAGELIARQVRRMAGRSEPRMAALLLGSVNALSAIINNVAATAIFVPVAERMATWFSRPRSRYLLPVAYASMTGGMCTLIGTSTNLAVSGELVRHGLEPLGMFELTPIGLVVAALAAAYLLLVAPRLLDRPGPGGAPGAPELKRFLFEILVRDRASIANTTIDDSRLRERFGLEVLAIERDGRRIDTPRGDQMIRPDDLLLVQGEAERLAEVRTIRGLELKALPLRELESGEGRLAEVTISFNSPLIGKTLAAAGFRNAHGVHVLAVRHREGLEVRGVGGHRLAAGDVLLAYGTEDAFVRLARHPAQLLVGRLVLPRLRPRRALLALSILGASIAATTAGWLDPEIAFLAGATVALIVRALPLERAGEYLNLRFLVLIAGMSALGVAMEQSGAAALVARGATQLAAGGGTLVLLGSLFALTILLTQPLNNAAAALLVLPVAVETATLLGLDPRSLAIVVAIAASCSFITPFEPACLLVYSTGSYRFGDFVRVGLGLTLLVALVSLALIPRLWPL